MALRWAVFADGLEQYWKLAADPSAHSSVGFREEEARVVADDEEWPFSFSNLCGSLGFRPESVRNVLVAWRNAHPTTIGRGKWANEVLEDFPLARGEASGN